jgi:hypothetical protein
MKRALVLALALLATAGCKKDQVPPAPDAAASATASASAAPAPPKDAGSDGKPRHWELTYTISAGTLYIPEAKDWSATKYKQDESKYLGEGKATISVDAGGRVAGTVDSGPLAPADIAGVVENGTLAATVRRKDPKDNGLTGTMLAKVDGTKAAGEMNLAEANAAVVRVAKVTGTEAE